MCVVLTKGCNLSSIFTLFFDSSTQLRTEMAPRHHLFLFLFLNTILLLAYSAKSDDANGQLLQGINSYRTSLNLSVFTDNKNADCLADQIAGQFKGQDCTNTTGSDTVPGTEPNFPNYPSLLDHCHLNVTVTRDGSIMPACIPGLVPSLVLSNFTESQYSQSLNGSTYSGVGIASEGNWVVVILTTDTPTGDFANADTSSSVSILDLHFHLLPLFLGFVLVLIG
ncbi:putative GPI-anchored protein At5g19250 [Tasmannia lanceolata]|uniref:putative GPI-anchored protein At5g19250 n=1 Tax=Tasmannia lanceolata TaxID=3420 RepID=UPI00406313EB